MNIWGHTHTLQYIHFCFICGTYPATPTKYKQRLSRTLQYIHFCFCLYFVGVAGRGWLTCCSWCMWWRVTRQGFVKKKKSILGCSYKKSVRTNEHSWAVPMNRMMFWRQSWCLLAPLVMRCCKVLLVYQSRSATREEMRCGVIAGSWYGHSSCFAYDADTNQDWRRE